MRPNAIQKHNATVALLHRIEATRFAPGSDAHRHYTAQAGRYEAAGSKEVAPARLAPPPR